MLRKAFIPAAALVLIAGPGSAAPVNVGGMQDAWFPGSSSVLEPEFFPSAFRGRWAPTRAGCDDIDGVDRLEVYAVGVDSYESGGRLLRITQSGQPRSVKVRLSYEGEGQFWDSEEVWALSADGNRLDIGFEAGGSRTLARCD